MTSSTPLFDAPGPVTRRRFMLINILAVLVLLAVIAWVVVQLNANGQLAASKWSPFLTWNLWENYLLPGLQGTLTAALYSVVLAGVFGVVFGLGRLFGNAVVRGVSGVVVEFFRAVPVLLMMVFVYQFLSVYSLVPPRQLALTAVVVALTVYNGSVVAELIRSGVLSLPRGQREAGLACGLTEGQTLRNVLLPQGLVAMFPALVSQLIVVVKDSALGYLIGYGELLRQAEYISTNFSNYIPAVIVIAIVFIVLNSTLALAADRLALRLRSRTAGRVKTAAPAGLNQI